MPTIMKCASMMLCVAFQLTAPCQELFAEDLSKDLDEKRSQFEKLPWADVGPAGERLKVLDFVAAQTKGNYEKIHTWKGEYSVTTTQRASEMLTNGALAETGPGTAAKKTPKADSRSGPLHQKIENQVKIVIDIKSGSVFRDTVTPRMSFSDARTGEAVKVRDVIPLDERTVVARDRFLHLPTNSAVPRYAVIPDHPEAQNKPAAFWDAPEKAKDSTGRLFDPRVFFGVDPVNQVWESIGTQTKGLRGKLGDRMKQEADRRLSLSKASEDKVVYYRHQFLFGNDAQKLVTSVIYSGRSGFNPVFVEQTFNNKPTRSVAVEWISNDGIFIPKKTTEVVHGDPGVLLLRTSALVDSRINDVIDKDQFELRGLGLKDGDLVLNEVEKVVYSVKNGGTVKLANYNEPYVSRPSALSSRIWILILLNLGIMIGCFFYIKRRARGKRRSEGGG